MSVHEVRFTVSHDPTPHLSKPSSKKSGMRKTSSPKPRFPPAPSPNFGGGGKRTTKNTTAAGNIVQQEDEYDDVEYSPRRRDDKSYRDPNGPYTNARKTRILLYLSLVWLLGLSIYVIVGVSIRGEGSNDHIVISSGRADIVAPPILEPKKPPTKWHIPFNLVPDNNVGSSGRIMSLKVPHLNFDRILRYDVCCRKGPYYVCRAVSKNVGIECYITNENVAVIHIGHPEMIGAACTLMWSETKEKGK